MAADSSGERDMRLAVLIDGDNVSAKAIGAILAEVATLGTASVKRIYGDFTTPGLSSWKGALREHAIQPVQQFANSVGKNATDSALIIDAMDLLHEKSMDGFCLVSSDADFTRLATRIREDGLEVYGFGEEKTPKAFVNACDRFTYIEILLPKPRASSEKPTPDGRALRSVERDRALRDALVRAMEAAAPEGGSAPLSTVGSHLSRLMPDFDSRNYGRRKLSDLIASVPGFRVLGSGRSLTVERQ